MSQDIRNFFVRQSGKPNETVKPQKTNKKPIITSDDEDVSKPKLNAKSKKTEKTSKKRNKHVLSDSEDEDIGKSTSNSKTPPKIEKNLKPVTPTAMFGGGPIKRVNVSPSKAKVTKEESAIHDDDEFDAVLQELDTSQFDDLVVQDSKQHSSNGKRKKLDSEEENTPKKVKLDESIKNREKSHVDDEDTQKASVSKIKKSSKTNAKTTKVELVVEKNPQGKTGRQKRDEEDMEFIEQRIEKKKQHAAAYQSYLHRGGARNPGSKTIPEGALNCLGGLSFVVTGVLESLERSEVDELIEKYGGRVLKAVSKKTNFIVVGEEAGQSKLAKAESYNIKAISEDDLLELIRKKSEGKIKKSVVSHSEKKEKSPRKIEEKHDKSPPSKVLPKEKSPEKIVKTTDPLTIPSRKEKSPVKLQSSLKDTKIESAPRSSSNQSAEPAPNMAHIGQELALTEKYRPKLMKQIIGQHGDKSCAKKFYTWLSNWHKNHSGKQVKQTKPSPWAKNDDGSFFKACLLSGPPGVGKTTTVQVVCKELGFDLLEFNASDTRSKRLLKEEISGLLSNTTVKGYFSTNSESKTSTKHVLLMDEVDGMAGNEDRGGLQELIALIKSTDIPIVCICNDRNNPKMRTLGNYIFDLRFHKPKIEQIKGAMMSLCCKENIKISSEDLSHLIQSTNYDVRQVINHLAMLVKEPMEKDEISAKLNKDLKLGPWDVVRKVFSADDHKNMNIHDKSALFFHDYNIAGLFVQENYLSVVPQAPKSEILDRIAASADSLSMGDMVEHSIRNNNAWSLLPMQACYSSVIPGTLMSGHITGQINFPNWLGRNSRRGKFDRLLQEITVHTRLVTGASKEAINIDYLKPLRDGIMRPLVTVGTEGVEDAIKIMNHYHLLRDDLDSLVEVSLWPGQHDPMKSVDSKVKAAFTRSYNKNAEMTPFSVVAVSKKKATASQDEGFIDDEEVDAVESGDDDDDKIDLDLMVKAKKPASKPSTSKTAGKNAGSTSKGREKTATKAPSKRGRGRGK